ncbi:MAG: hypothetical protein WCR46_12745, partial [Deltaproteobacteria bacterium]
MTAILQEAFNMASGFSEKEQEIIALRWIGEMKIPDFIEMIKDDVQWEKSFYESQDVLEMLADKAIKEAEEGKSERIGWDEL